MKLRISLVINDPDIQDILRSLGPYKRVVFIREALSEFSKSEKGNKLYERLISKKKDKQI